jgi:hypothetical protein
VLPPSPARPADWTGNDEPRFGENAPPIGYEEFIRLAGDWIRTDDGVLSCACDRSAWGQRTKALDHVFGFPIADYYQLAPGKADRFPNPALPRSDNPQRF